ncbi:MAG: chalcone isomerase family protein [Verrucomicrobiota bacterium]
MRAFYTLILLLVTTTSSALAGAMFPKQIEALDQNFQKLGEYRYVYRMFFRLYEAALFTEPGASAEEVLRAETAFHLQFRYLRKIDKAIILKSADRMLEKNLSPKEKSAIAARVDTINEAYTTVRKGDRSSLTYEPGVGTTLMINDKPVVTIEGRDFAQLYFRIWLGEQAISKSLRKNLLGLG